jgi:hypothetical protein
MSSCLKDLSIRCWQEQHLFYIWTLGLPLLLLYVVGVPLAVLYTLCNKENKPRVINILSTVRANLPPPHTDELERSEPPPRALLQQGRLEGEVAPHGAADNKTEGRKKPKRDIRQSLSHFATKMFTTRKQQQDQFDPATQTFHRNFSFMFLGYKVCVRVPASHRCFVCAS